MAGVEVEDGELVGEEEAEAESKGDSVGGVISTDQNAHFWIIILELAQTGQLRRRHENFKYLCKGSSSAKAGYAWSSFTR